MSRLLSNLFLLCFCSVLGAFAKDSNIFISAELGAKTNHLSISTSPSQTYLTPAYGVRFGYEFYFRNFGLGGGVRFYGDVNYENISLDFDDSHVDSSMLHYGLNVDYLLEFFNPINPTGAFVGIGYEWDSTELAKKLIQDPKNQYIHQNSNGFLFNIGISQTFFKANKIELGARIPLYSYIQMQRISKMKNLKIKLRSWGNFYLAYSYLF